MWHRICRMLHFAGGGFEIQFVARDARKRSNSSAKSLMADNSSYYCVGKVGSGSSQYRKVGQPILAAAGFKPAIDECEDSRVVRRAALKAAAGKIARPTVLTARKYTARAAGRRRRSARLP